MRKKNNTSKKVIACLSVAALLAVGVGIGIKSNGFTNWDTGTWFSSEIKEAPEKGNMTAEVKATGMQVKRLSSVTNEQGHVTNTYSYSISPENATRKEMTISIAWNGEKQADIGEVLTVAIDSSAQTFSITKLQDFDVQAKATIQSTANEDVKAEILVDCKQVFLGLKGDVDQDLCQILTDTDSVNLYFITALGANLAGVGNLSSVYTIPLVGDWSIMNPSATFHGYITGNSRETMVDTGMAIGNDWAAKNFDYCDDFSLENLQSILDADISRFGENKIAVFESNAMFGVEYEINATINQFGETAHVRAVMKAIAEVKDLDFGSAVNSITPEDSHVVFGENDDISYRYFLERAGGSEANSFVEQTLELTKMGDTDWYESTAFDIGYGQAFRVRINPSEGHDTYSAETFAWVNQATGGKFVYYAGEGNVTWNDAIQNLGGGLYYVSL